MARFFRLPANAEKLKTLQYMECNHFKLAESLTQMQRRFFDVIDYESNSYFTHKSEIRVPVGLGDKSLPQMPQPKRMRVKTAAPRMVVRKTGNDDAAAKAHCEGSQTSSTSYKPAAKARSQGSQTSSGKTEDQEGSLTSSENERLEREFRQDRDRFNELKVFFRQHWTCVSTQVLLQQMSEEQRAWFTTGWPQQEDLLSSLRSCDASFKTP